MHNTINYTWEQFDFDIAKLKRWITEVDFNPNMIVGLHRGGMVPAIALSHSLDVPCIPLEWSTRDSKRCDHVTAQYITSLNNKGIKVLVVDDIVDSGLTISSLKPHINLRTNSVLYTSLWYNPSQSCSMHFWANVIDRSVDDRWIIFPWEEK